MNYIIFVYDSLRADHLSHLGYNRKTSPNIDSLADEGVSFSKAFSQAYWTGPSAGSIMNSQYPLVHRTGFLYRSKSEHTTIADPFADEGFRTGCITTASAISESNYPNFGHHEHIYDSFDIDDPRLGRHVSNRVVNWIEENKNEDFFLLVWSDGTHTPYDVPNDWKNQFLNEDIDGTSSNLNSMSSDEQDIIIDLYDENIRYNDKQLGDVVRYLKEENIYDKTTFIITADHGEIFHEHERMELASRWSKQLAKLLLSDSFTTRNSIVKSTGFTGHQAVLPYDELMNVPLIINSPQVNNNTNIDKLSQTIDIGPTLCDMARDVDTPESFQGRSLLPAINRKKKVNEYVYSFTPVLFGVYIHKMVRSDSFKYIETELKDADKNLWKEFKINPARVGFSVAQYLSVPREVFFELPGDEQQNMIKEYSHKAAELSNQIQSIRWKSGGFDINIDSKTVDHLEDLGYL